MEQYTQEDLQKLTKAELIEIANQWGSTFGMNKAQVIDFIIEHQSDGSLQEGSEETSEQSPEPGSESSLQEGSEETSEQSPEPKQNAFASVIASELAKRASRHKTGLPYNTADAAKPEANANIAIQAELAKRASRFGVSISSEPTNYASAIQQELARRSLKVK